MNSCTNIISDVCPNVGGMQNMVTALLVMSASMLTPKNVVWSVPITNVVFVNLVCQVLFLESTLSFLCMVHVSRPNLPPKTRSTSSLPIVLDRAVSIGPRVPSWAVSGSESPFICMLILIPNHCSPKPGLPPPKAYEPPSPPSNRDLGPPPPGYGRYADYDRGSLGASGMNQGNAGMSATGPRRNLDDVLCFKVSLNFSPSIHTLTSPPL